MSARVAIYARVSTTNHGQDAGLQTGEMRQFAEARGWTLAGEYVDAGVSGAKDSRPELNRLMSDAHEGRFDVVLVWKLDRFGRSLRHLVNALAEFESLGIAFVSLSDNLDLSTASGRLMFNIIGAMAEFERALIQERVKAGIRNARAKGRRIGRPRANVDADQIARAGAQLEENGAWSRNSLPRHSGEQAYLLIIFRLLAAIVMVPPFSVTSPVSSTLWLRWGTSFALLFAARSPVTV